MSHLGAKIADGQCVSGKPCLGHVSETEPRAIVLAAGISVARQSTDTFCE